MVKRTTFLSLLYMMLKRNDTIKIKVGRGCFCNQYIKIRLQECIGTGKYGKVFSFKVNGTMSKNVIRISTCSEKGLQLHRSLSDYSPPAGFCKLYMMGRFKKRGFTFHYSIIDWCSGGELFDRANDGTFLEPDGLLELKYCIRDILINLAYMHRHSIIHTDVKPENVMFRNGSNNACLVDFGGVIQIGEPTRGGTIPYNSPEQRAIILDTGKGLLSTKTDIFSLGVTILVCLTRKDISDEMGCQEGSTGKMVALNAITEEMIKDTIQRYCAVMDPCTVDFITLLLKCKPSERPSAVDALSHSWFDSL